MPAMTKPTPDGLALLDELADDLEAAAVAFERSQMFGSPGFRLPGKGKFFATLVSGEEMIFKLHGAMHASALELDGAHLFEPMPGRPMKQWVQVPSVHRGKYLELATAAAQSVG